MTSKLPVAPLPVDSAPAPALRFLRTILTASCGIPIALSFACLMSMAAPAGAQTCPSGNVITTPSGDLIDNADGTITHPKTGLMWKQCSEGQSPPSCTGTLKTLHWADAQGAAFNANIENFAGHADWRLPNLKELASIAETGCYQPSINTTRFPGTIADNFWTSTTVFASPGSAFAVTFFDGTVFYSPKTIETYYVRLVRGGQPRDSFDGLAGGCTLDIDGNGVQDALTDGLMILRAMFGLTGTSVTNNAIGSGSPTRVTWTEVRNYLNGNCGGNFAP